MKIFMGMLGQEVKKAIDLTAKTAINTSMNIVLSSEVFPKIKQNTKEAIEYTVHTVNRELVAQYMKPIRDRKSTRLNSSHGYISYAVFCLKKKKNKKNI